MKKLIKIISGIIIFSVVSLIILSVLFFDDVYNSRYSAGNTNAKFASFEISNALKNGDIALDNADALIYGRMDHETIFVYSINHADTDINFNTESDMGNYYWAASIKDNKLLSVWVCNKDILEDDLLKVYEYGDQRNYISVYGNYFIGYYSN